MESIEFPDCQCIWDDKCWVQGRGTISAIRGRRAHFDVFFSKRCSILLTVQIKGPANTVCSKQIDNPGQGNSPIRGSNFQGRPFQLGGPKGDSSQSVTPIPLWYQTTTGKISIYYIPLVTGIHKIRLTNHSAQIRGSPFTVYVKDETSEFGDSSISLSRSETFTPSHEASESTSKPGVRIIGVVDKNRLKFPLIDVVRKSKSSGTLSSSASPRLSADEVKTIWKMPVQCKDSEDLSEDDDSPDDNDTKSFNSSRCQQCWPSQYDNLEAGDFDDSKENESWLRYRAEHFEKHSLRVKALIDYWNKMSISCSEDNRCSNCLEISSSLSASQDISTRDQTS